VRSNASLGWEHGNLGLTWGLRYFSAVKERCLGAEDYPNECSHPDQRAPWFSGTRDYNRRGSVTFHDVQARYSLPWDATVSIGANNVFGRQVRPCTASRVPTSPTTVATTSAVSST
jgi:iron complex outermembrane receptor protein